MTDDPTILDTPTDPPEDDEDEPINLPDEVADGDIAESEPEDEEDA